MKHRTPFFNITFENNSFSINTQDRWTSEDDEETIDKLIKLLALRSQNDVEHHGKEVEKSGTRFEIENQMFSLAGFDHFNSEIFSEIRRVRYKRIQELIYIMELTFDEIVDILDMKTFAGSIIGYTLPSGVNEIFDLNLILHSLLPNEVKVNITKHDIGLRLKLPTNKTIKFTEKNFFLYHNRIYPITFRFFEHFSTTIHSKNSWMVKKRETY